MRETGSSTNWSAETPDSITLSGTKEEMDKVRQMLAGTHWLCCGDGAELVTVERLKSLPSPIEDPMVPPKWGYKVPPLGVATEADIVKAELAARPRYALREDVDPGEGWHSPSIIVKHLVAYNVRTTTYEAEAKKMMAYGFECLRSRRGGDGRFWEAWYLPGFWAALGPFKAEVVDNFAKGVSNNNWVQEARSAVDWLCKHVSFGCLDVTVQRAAMIID